MKKSATLIKNRIQAMIGRAILAMYRTYSSVFIKKEGFTHYSPPVQEREIILVKRINRVYSITAQQYIAS
jgi:hypothetical protein